MPTPTYFSKYPAIPSDIPVAKLPIISFSKLLSDDKDESSAVFGASRATGFSILDMSGCPAGEEFWKRAEAMFDLNDEPHLVLLQNSPSTWLTRMPNTAISI